jgi:hypothetical protein
MMLDAKRLADAKLYFDVKASGDIEITDDSEPINLFNRDAVEMLCGMFGDHRAEEMLMDADMHISMEIFARKISNAMLRK